jgi:hypothetical protein
VSFATTIRQTIMRAFHDHPASGHFGIAKTYEIPWRWHAGPP